MVKITHPFETKIRRTIRDAYALDPLIDIPTLLKHLKQRFDGRDFDYTYIKKLIKKIDKEVTPNLDREKVENELKVIREKMRIHIERLSIIAMGQALDDRPKPTYTEMTQATRAISALLKFQLDAALDLGVYKKSDIIPTTDDWRFQPMDPELRQATLTALKLWKMPEGLMRKIEPMQIIEAKEVAPVEAPKITSPQNGITVTPIGSDPELRLY